jgi:single-stranded DNA-binding protein
LAYIGEAEKLSKRIKEHAVQKDWWDNAVLITTAANSLHKAHVKYLESRLVEIAKNISHSSLENANIPPKSSLSEADIANMESFLETLQIVLPAIRVDTFLDKSVAVSSDAGQQETPVIVFELVKLRSGVNAKAFLRKGELVVQAGSLGRDKWVGDTTQKTHYHKLYHELCNNGTLVIDGDQTRFTKNHAFSSPSAAGAIVNGRSTNGRTEWKLAHDGRTYEQWENDQMAEDSKIL